MTSDDLISLHAAAENAYFKAADVIEDIQHFYSEPPQTTTAWVAPLSDLATQVQALAVVQRDLLAGLLT